MVQSCLIFLMRLKPGPSFGVVVISLCPVARMPPFRPTEAHEDQEGNVPGPFINAGCCKTHQNRYNSIMNKPSLKVAFYTLGTKKPVRDWLLKLEPKQRKEIGADIQAVQWRWPVSKPLVDGLGGGLYEVRSTVRRRAFRVFFCIKSDSMVLLHGIEKKTQKAPKQALEMARKRMKEVCS